LKPWHGSAGLPEAWRDLNAGSCTPPPRLVCLQPRLLQPPSAYARFYQAGPPRQPRRPPSALSPFAQLGCYLRWGDVIRLLGGRYPSVVAHTGSCATPVELSLPSAISLVPRVLAGCTSPCCSRQLPDVISESPSLDAGSCSPAARRVLSPVSSTASSAFPQRRWGRLPASNLRLTTSRRELFRGCRYSVMFRPPSLLTPQVVPTAANTPAGQPGLLRPGLLCFVASAHTGYANRPNTGN